jgi:hypothetical protein
MIGEPELSVLLGSVENGGPPAHQWDFGAEGSSVRRRDLGLGYRCSSGCLGAVEVAAGRDCRWSSVAWKTGGPRRTNGTLVLWLVVRGVGREA